MDCCQCQGIEQSFDRKLAARKLEHFRSRGPDKTTRMLIQALQSAGVSDMTLLDIGGGVGAVQYALLEAGVQHATDVDASSAYLNAARSEAQRRGVAERIHYRFGNFVDLAADLPPADIVTLDRVICCYHDMPRLVGLSSQHARRLYGVVYPRNTWWVRLGLWLGNLLLWLQRNPFRAFSHPPQAVEAILQTQGFKRHSYQQTLVWQVVVYARD